MKVGICAHFLEENGYGGKKRYTYNLINHLVSLGIDVYIICSIENDVINGKRISLYDNRSNNVISKYLKPLLYLHKINSLNLDIIHCPGEIIPPYFWFINAIKIITFGGDELVNNNINYNLKKELLTPTHLFSLFLIRILKSKICKFIVVSNMMKKNISKGYNININKISVIKHGVYTSIFQELSEYETQKTLTKLNIYIPYILHVSSYRKIKNIPRIIRAFSKVIKNKKYNNLTLVIAGKKNYQYKKIKKLAIQMGIENKIKFLGSINKELPALYAGAEVLCQPSFRETFGFPILESLACGTPVITSKDVGVLENAEGLEAQIQVDPTNEKEIEHAIKSIVFNKELKMKLKKAGFKLVKKHSWINCAKKHIKLYQQAINEITN